MKKENENLIVTVRELMDNFDLPDWLQKKMINVLEAKKQSMTDQALQRYLEQLGHSETLELPDEFMDKQWLQSVYDAHSQWVDEQIAFLEETTYESFSTQLEKNPAKVHYMRVEAQKSYIAISACLLNIFAQLDGHVHLEEKTEEGQTVAETSNKKRGIFRFVKLGIGYILIVYSYLIAITFLTILGEGSIFLSLFTLIIMGMLPFTIGLFLIKPVTLKDFFHHRLFRIYCFFSVVVPMGFYIFINMMEWKKGMLSDPDFIFLRLVSSQWVGIFQSILLIMIILLFAPVLVWKENRKKFVISIGTLLLVFALFQYVTMQDYQAIGKDGIVQSEFGSGDTYDWTQVESVTLSGETDFPDASGIRNSKRFTWSFLFKMKNGETVLFDLFGYKEGPIKDSVQIKNKVEDENIPLQIEPLTEEDRSFIKIDMADHQGDLRNDFYKLFETDSF